jgi:hypothetical protein
MELEFSRQIFEKYSNVKFNKNPTSGSRVFPCGQMDGRTNMTKLIVAFRNFATAPINMLMSLKVLVCQSCIDVHIHLSAFSPEGVIRDGVILCLQRYTS